METVTSGEWPQTVLWGSRVSGQGPLLSACLAYCPAERTSSTLFNPTQPVILSLGNQNENQPKRSGKAGLGPELISIAFPLFQKLREALWSHQGTDH